MYIYIYIYLIDLILYILYINIYIYIYTFVFLSSFYLFQTKEEESLHQPDIMTKLTIFAAKCSLVEFIGLVQIFRHIVVFSNGGAVRPHQPGAPEVEMSVDGPGP